MKKVNLIGKKIMSAGLAASLLVTSLGNTSCFANGTKTAQNVDAQQKSAAVTNNESGNTKPTDTSKIQAVAGARDESGNIINNVVFQFINDSKKSNKSTPKKKDVSANKKEELKKSFKKAFDVTKWVLISGFLAYAGYKNGKDIINCLKECWDFIIENEDNFKEVLDGGIAAVKGIGNAAKGTAQLIWEIISFAAHHTEATKNVMATVGTYSIYKSLKNKINNFINKKDNKKVKNSFKLDGSITIKQ